MTSARADLALSPDEITIENGVVNGIAHNIGSASAPCEVALVDAKGEVVARQNLGMLEAPLDLLARRKSFALKLPTPAQNGHPTLPRAHAARTL